MSNDPPEPGRWPRGSKAEDDEVHRQQELARLEQWMIRQRLRPLTDALEEHGIQRGGGEGWAGPPFTPDWFDQVPPPPNPCPWCQRNVPASPCPECRAAREQAGDPAGWAWWAGLAPERRRLYLAARWHRDPWSLRPVRIDVSWTEAASDGTVTAARLPYCPHTPATAWDLDATQN